MTDMPENGFEGEVKRVLMVCEDFIYKGDSAPQEERGAITGYGAFYGNIDMDGDVIEPGTFEESMDEHRKSGAAPHMFYNHNINEPVGSWNKLEDKTKGLMHSGQIAVGRGIPKAEQAHIVASSKAMKGLSIGFQISKGGATYGDGKAGSPNRIIKAGRLVETSIVPFPKNAKAVITGVKGAIGDKEYLSVREAEEILRDVANFSGTEAKSFLARLCKGYDLKRDAEIGSKQKLDMLQNGLLNLISTLKG